MRLRSGLDSRPLAGAISHHLRALREAGLVVSRREARMVFYSLTAEATALLERVVGTEVSA